VLTDPASAGTDRPRALDDRRGETALLILPPAAEGRLVHPACRSSVDKPDHLTCFCLNLLRPAAGSLGVGALDELLLHRVQVTVASQPLHGDHVAEVELENESDAGIDDSIVQSSGMRATHEYATGAAVPFRADDLGTARPSLLRRRSVSVEQPSRARSP
jgi:hypothetical protein